MDLPGREHGYFQVAHFDFPLNDSLTKTFAADETLITVNVRSVIVSSADFWGDPVDVIQSTDTVPFNLKRTHSSVDVANSLQNIMSVLTDHNDNAYRWQNWFNGISFDQSAQKFAIQYTKPDSVSSWLGPLNNALYFIRRIVVTFEGTHTGQQGRLAAAIFGGKTIDNGTGWISEFDTGETEWFHQQATADETTTPLRQAGFSYNVFSQRPPRMFIDPYVYIRGTPEQSIWRADGSSTDIMTIQPRNRPPGVITNEQAFLANQTHQTKSTLPSLRSMVLRFTDSNDNIIQLDEEYVIKVGIEFHQ